MPPLARLDVVMPWPDDPPIPCPFVSYLAPAVPTGIRADPSREAVVVELRAGPRGRGTGEGASPAAGTAHEVGGAGRD